MTFTIRAKSVIILFEKLLVMGFIASVLIVYTGSKDISIMEWLAGIMKWLLFRISDITHWLSFRISDITHWLSFRGMAVIVAILVVLGAGGGFLLLHRNNSQQNSTIRAVYSLQQIPAPDAARTEYANTKYKYYFIYPSEWEASENQFHNVDTVNVSYPVQTGPDVRLLDVNCAANPSNWDAQTWWQHNPTGTQIGLSTLTSGEKAFVSVTSSQQAEQGYTQYIVVHNYSVCWLAAFTANVANENLIDDIVNTFHWN